MKTETDIYEEKIRQVKDDFSVNDMITICNVLCIENADSLDDLIKRIISIFCELSVLISNIIHEDNDNNDNETEINVENISSRNIGDVNPENNIRKDSSSTKNEMAQLPIHDILPRPSISFNYVENMTVSFDVVHFKIN